MKNRIYLDPKIVRDLIEYNPDTGVFTWKTRDRCYFDTNRGWSIWNARHAGKEAGSLRQRKDGYTYRRMGWFNRDVMAHRLAWVYMTGDQPPHEIDHINMDATDCRWSNLRNGDGINQRNKTKNRKNTSGYVGVYKHSMAKDRWVARVTLNGEHRHLGMAGSAEEAYALVKAAHAENGFTDSHGMQHKPYE